MSFSTSTRRCDWQQKWSFTHMRSRFLSYAVFPVVGAVLLVTPFVGASSSWQGASGSSASVGATSQACVYEGHLETDKNWYGYLANITVMTTGRLTFEFVYPADKCCQNVLFYSEDQMAVINARMNCWQKEYPLRPEDDQILRLTPRFSWSGCHKTYPNNIAMYVCKGGRSFTVDQHRHQYSQQHQRYDQHPHRRQQQQQQQGWRQSGRGEDGAGQGYGTWGGSSGRGVHDRNRPTTWYIALSNCGSLYGLELRYRMEVYGHVGECRRGLPAHFDYYRPGVSSFDSPPSPRPVVSAPDADHDEAQVAVADDVAAAAAEAMTSCVMEGDINTTETWYVIGNASRTTNDGDATWFKFNFSFPQSVSLLHMGLYGEVEQIELQQHDNCWNKQSVIPPERVHDRLLEMSYRTGCHLKNTTKYGLSYVCGGRHPFIPGPVGPAAGSERQILVAIDNCRLDQLVARYRVEMYGFVCSSAASLGLPLPTVHWKLPLPTPVISVVRAVICAVFPQVFFCLGSFVASASSTSRLMPS